MDFKFCDAKRVPGGFMRRTIAADIFKEAGLPVGSGMNDHLAKPIKADRLKAA